eukprot:810289-Prorocentrum_minimum.AAC.2
MNSRVMRRLDKVLAVNSTVSVCSPRQTCAGKRSPYKSRPMGDWGTWICSVCDQWGTGKHG